jgi:hypothetical protein
MYHVPCNNMLIACLVLVSLEQEGRAARKEDMYRHRTVVIEGQVQDQRNHYELQERNRR